MNILFIHPNFPAQFKHIAKIASDEGHDVKFLCQTHYGRTLNGVKRLTLKGSCSAEELEKLDLNIFDKIQKIAKQFRTGFEQLKNSGWIPDLAISHSGWGCGLYAKEMWSDCVHISYLEWWFNPKSEFFTYDPNNKFLGINQKFIEKGWNRNQTIALELASSDAIVAPTEWQKNQLPDILRANCTVIFDGIDRNFFDSFPANRSKQIDKSIVTYGTRGMEAIRLFPQFIQSLPAVVKKYPKISIQVAGQDSIHYCGGPPNGFKSWKPWAKDYLRRKGCLENVQWLGYLNKNEYAQWLKNSDCHVYLSHPFIMSWSFADAIQCGTNIVTSDIEATKEFNIYAQSQQIKYIDHRSIKNISDAISTTISEKRISNNIFLQEKILTMEESWTLWKLVYRQSVVRRGAKLG